MRRNWKRTIELWQASGLTKSEFCRKNSISLGNFSRHSLKLGAFSHPKKLDQKARKRKDKSFAEVICKPSKRESVVGKKPLILHLDCGGSIELTENFDAETLKRALRIASEL